MKPEIPSAGGRLPDRDRKLIPILVHVATFAAVLILLVFMGSRLTRLMPRRATSSDPETALDQERAVHGVGWGLSYYTALEQASSSGSPVLIYFGSTANYECTNLETVFADPEITPLLSQFVTVQLYIDRVQIGSLSEREQFILARANAVHELELVEERSAPCLVILSSQGELITKRHGYQRPEELAAFLRRALRQAEHRARAGSEKRAEP
jgi:hypothetical protein